MINAGEGVEKRGPSYTLVVMKMDAATVVNSIAVP